MAIERSTAMTNDYDHKWEWWSNGRRRSRTICVRLWLDSADLTIAQRAVGSDGRMSELNAFSCDAKHLTKLIHALKRALTVTANRGLKPIPRSATGALRAKARPHA